MNLESMFHFRQAMNVFRRNHPKLQPFVDGIQQKGFCEGMEIAVAVRYPDGDVRKTGIRVTASDMDLLNTLKGMK